MRLDAKINDKEVARFLARRVPTLTNQEMNKAYRRAISEFAKGFDKAKLGPGGVFHVRRKVQIGKTPRGQPSIPKRMRKAGFVARLKGAQDLDRKYATIYTGNPLLKIRETGGPVRVRPRRPGGFLYIKDPGGFRGRGAAAKRRAVEAKLNPTASLNFRRSRAAPIIAKVREVNFQQAPVLGFADAWRAFQPRAKFIVRQGLAEVQRRFALEGAKKFAPRGEAASA